MLATDPLQSPPLVEKVGYLDTERVVSEGHGRDVWPSGTAALFSHMAIGVHTCLACLFTSHLTICE